MDIPQKCLCDEEIKKITEKNFTIIIHMKKMEGSNNVVGSGTSAATAFLHQQCIANNHSILSGDTNNNSSSNNNHSVDNSSGNENKSNSKSESSTISCGKKAFYKLIFNKSSGSNSSDNNNNSNSNQSSNTPPLNNSYTKVSMERTANGSIESKISQMSIDQNRQSISSQSHQGNSLVVSPTSIDLSRR
jgi:hypothetical protein